ncbi:MAG: hypothetical protein PWP41_139 [Moorella sp. (in: firmicutes)]|uniref:Uncharacterized protein n=1 Tax=Neomoorella thermoacetica TaxID=1525 RepID=A0A1J5NKA6_NEOTH|nr:hypothetical protein [Moorella sp. (in: firmicutes)]OIQ59006.1 hypothetical protein MOTE_14190 [Moorella thermoacetica]
MLISTMTVVALRCPSCGRLEFHGLSLFNFSGHHTWQMECSCGMVLMTMGTRKGRNYFWLQYHCGMCDNIHVIYHHRRELWSQELLTLTCSETDLEVGFVGPRDKVQQAVQQHDRSLAEMAEDLGFGGYFEEPDVMYQLLALVFQLAEGGHVRCCCGNDNIEVEIFPGHLQLRCDACGAEKILPASTITNLEKPEDLEEILLPGHLAGSDGAGPGKGRRHRQKSPV